MSFFARVVTPNEYHFSGAAQDSDDVQRLEDIIEATDLQLAVWNDICQLAQQSRTSPIEGDEHTSNKASSIKLKHRLLEL